MRHTRLFWKLYITYLIAVVLCAGVVRFSHDGTWVAFGDGSDRAGGGRRVQHPRAVPDWEWSPTDDVLAGVTRRRRGGRSSATTSGCCCTTVRDAGHVAYIPNGRSLAMDVGGDRVAVVG